MAGVSFFVRRAGLLAALPGPESPSRVPMQPLKLRGGDVVDSTTEGVSTESPGLFVRSIRR